MIWEVLGSNFLTVVFVSAKGRGGKLSRACSNPFRISQGLQSHSFSSCHLWLKSDISFFGLLMHLSTWEIKKVHQPSSESNSILLLLFLALFLILFNVIRSCARDSSNLPTSASKLDFHNWAIGTLCEGCQADSSGLAGVSLTFHANLRIVS